MISLIIFSIFILEKYAKLNKKYQEIVNYVIVGGFTTVVSILSYYFFRIFLQNYVLCTVLSWIVAVSFAYITNRKYVFHSNEKNIYREFFEFTCSRILSLLSEVAVMFILVDFLSIQDKLAKIIVQIIIMILNYIFSKLFVFKEK